MKRLNLPLNARMQNFLFLDDGTIFWTTAVKTIRQKIAYHGEKHKSIANTSAGFVIEDHHGQNIRTNGKNVIVQRNKFDEVLHARTGEVMVLPVSSLPVMPPIKALCPGKYLQGVAYVSRHPSMASFGKPGKDSIEVYHIVTKEQVCELHYKDHKKWWWKEWEAEGLQIDQDSSVWVGINVKSWFGFHCNYIKRITDD